MVRRGLTKQLQPEDEILQHRLRREMLHLLVTEVGLITRVHSERSWAKDGTLQNTRDHEFQVIFFFMRKEIDETETSSSVRQEMKYLIDAACRLQRVERGSE